MPYSTPPPSDVTLGEVYRSQQELLREMAETRAEVKTDRHAANNRQQDLALRLSEIAIHTTGHRKDLDLLWAEARSFDDKLHQATGTLTQQIQLVAESTRRTALVAAGISGGIAVLAWAVPLIWGAAKAVAAP
jgi:hypothetical protein